MTVLEDYFQERNVLREAENYVKVEWEQMQALFPNSVSCRIPAFFWPDNTIVRVEPGAAKLDLRPGDRLIMIDGTPDDDWQGVLPMVIEHRPNEELNLTLIRDGIKLERKVKCLDGEFLRSKWTAALDAAHEGRWHECAMVSEELDRPPLTSFSGITLLRYHCSQADRVISYHIVSETDAKLLYQARTRQLEEAKYIPGGTEKIKGKVLEAIEWLERNNFRSIANALEKALKEHTST